MPHQTPEIYHNLPLHLLIYHASFLQLLITSPPISLMICYLINGRRLISQNPEDGQMSLLQLLFLCIALVLMIWYLVIGARAVLRGREIKIVKEREKRGILGGDDGAYEEWNGGRAF